MGSVATGVVDSTRPIQEVDTPSRAFDPDTPDLAAPQPSHCVDMSDTQCSQSQSHDAEVTPGSQHDIQGEHCQQLLCLECVLCDCHGCCVSRAYRVLQDTNLDHHVSHKALTFVFMDSAD